MSREAYGYMLQMPDVHIKAPLNAAGKFDDKANTLLLRNRTDILNDK